MKLLNRKAAGLTLIEIMISIVIILVAIVGSISFRYHTAMDARKADAKISAARVGTMLLDAWKGTGGKTTFDPVTDLSGSLTISTCITGPAVPTGFTELDSYLIVNNRANYYTTLSYKASTTTVPGILTVTVAWLVDYKAGTISASDASVILTAYVRN